MQIDLYTNTVAGGWLPTDEFLGGSEESLVLWAEALTRKGHEVTIYLNTPDNLVGFHEGVCYRRKEEFDFSEYRECLITFKDPKPWLMGSRAKIRLHWSGEVEPGIHSWVRGLTSLICISDYHLSRLEGLPEGIGKAFPLGVDLIHLDKQKVDKVDNTMLYCSSPDRGLEQLLRDWPKIRENHPDLELRVAYGWKNFDACTQGDPQAQRFKSHLLQGMQREGIVNLGELSRDQIAQEYWRAEYWVLPLQNPDSELFCLNAIKARHCGAMPVVNRIGALKNTVGKWHKYNLFINSGEPITTNRLSFNETYPVQSWDQVIEQYWELLIQEAG
jgi:glycosyltransferase involved in cell wall biosynthesis